MTTRLQLRTALRERLEDTAGSPLWSDATLNQHLADVVQQYGSRYPLEASTTLALAAGDTSKALPAGVEGERLLQLADALGNPLPRATRPTAGDAPANRSSSQQLEWWDFAGALKLSRAVLTAEPGTWTLGYLAGRTLPADDVSDSMVLAGDEPAIVYWAAAIAIERRSIADAKRDRRPDNELRGQAYLWRQEAEVHFRQRRRQLRSGTVN